MDRVDAHGGILGAHVGIYGDCTSPAKANPESLPNLHGGAPARLDLLWASYDYRPGIAYNIHDQCDGCMLSDVASHGWNTGIRLSNVWAVNINNAVLETANLSPGPKPPPVTTYGLLAENCVMANIVRLHVGGFATGAALYGTSGPHAADPGYSCSPNEQAGNMGITLVGGEIGSPTRMEYGIDIGPYSRGVVYGVSINNGGKAAVNVGPHAYGWVLRDMMPYNVGKEGWIRIDPSSAHAVTANAIGSDLRAPLILGGLPSSPSGLPHDAIWNNHGVLSIVP